jgi:serine phosphatase RsbU (regulator of sigma subunit)
MLTEIQIFFSSVPPSLAPRLHEEHKVAKIAFSLGCVAHSLFIPLFWFTGAPVMSYINVGSSLFFVLALWISARRHSTLLVALGYIEVIIHALAASYYTGFGTGFHFYLFLVFQLSFMITRQSVGILLSATALLAYVFTIYMGNNFSPVYSVEPLWEALWVYSNIINVVSVTLIVAFYNKKMNEDSRQAMMESNEELNQQKQEIEAQSEQIMTQNEKLKHAFKQIQDNIGYAKTIQLAMLPSDYEMRKAFGDNFFVFYSPKDVVAGDFYWMHHSGDQIILAVGDCTGHGVSGAMLTMMGSSMLNNIVIERGIKDPGTILEELHIGIFNFLKQGNSNVRDGMDISICTFAPAERSIQFAAARQSLVYFSQGELQHLKGTRRSIGGKSSAKEQNFQTHFIDASNPVQLYLLTDGLQDQFGGTENRKFLFSRVLQLLRRIAPLDDLSIQKSEIHRELSEWRGSHRKIDDVLIVGIRTS